ncbi:hypothetical protein CHGG_04444 [Chaetomium globosum CBS 148.51]|uniref:VPS9 domain-containing protein n=1 Tax=Chaetomium globosum (strain ATCC 6205 / CBS 148.51 / DSM 1962 / NBRC 6347 / NRRL 1970) TaxID=306901 RepID=Q2H1A2_CHAGB|nr:uncharacterized protein CHGG_04444 [Chaetomium globosum CBS 148.51]EAQ87825.1 hypothetical protein CHGG_04444 [Chaetomium globosum CBS 148.51]
MSPHNQEAILSSPSDIHKDVTIQGNGDTSPFSEQAPRDASPDAITTSAVQGGAAGEEDLLNLSNGKRNQADENSEAASQSLGGPTRQDKLPEDNDLMSSSIATLKPTTSPTTTTSTQYLTAESKTYVDPTPPTPTCSRPPSRAPSSAPRSRSDDPSPTRSDAAYDDKRYTSEDEQEHGSRSEIQSIMEQFSELGGGPGAEEVMSPRLEIASPLLGGRIQHPPRKSSLEPLAPTAAHQFQDAPGLHVSTSSLGTLIPPCHPSPRCTAHHRPNPNLEPALPFDFHRFLEQLRNKKADPVARYLKSFLSEFGKRQWMVHEQVKIISDFLAFIGNKMAQCEVWRDVPDTEFDNAPPQPVPGVKKKRGADRVMGPGRRGQHQEDVERDEILAQKINIYSWVREEHLDIPPVSDSGKRFLKLAQQGLLKHTKSDSSADSFMPMLIYVVLQANPEHLVSNVQYILRFRNQEKLGGEAGYYLSSLFIENMDRTTLTITDEEFENNVEAAVSAIAEKHRAESPPAPPSHSEKPTSLRPPHLGESGPSSTRPSLDVDRPASPRRSTSSNEPRDSGEYSGSDEKAAITGLLRSIQKPLSTIGRIFSDEPSSSSAAAAGTNASIASPARTPQPERGDGDLRARQRLSAEEAAARQASAETAEAQRLHRAEHANVVETLAGMFPDLDRDIISDVVYQKEGRVGLAVDACLALST